MDEQERKDEETPEVEGHAASGKSLYANQDPAAEGDETDDVEAHQIRPRPTNY